MSASTYLGIRYANVSGTSNIILCSRLPSARRSLASWLGIYQIVTLADGFPTRVHTAHTVRPSTTSAMSVDTTIYNKVNRVLYTSSPSSLSTFRALINHLVCKGILSDEECDRHDREINDLFRRWQQGSEGNLQQSQTTHQHSQGPASPLSLSIPDSPPAKVASSPPYEGSQAELPSNTVLVKLKEALRHLDLNVSPL